MISRIIQFSIQNKIIITALVLALIVWGGYSLNRLPLDGMPDITNNQVNVVTIAPNLGPVEMEQFVTYPVEIAMANIQGLINVRSVSQFGLSLITLEFDEKTDNYWARNQATERLTKVTQDIPAGFGKPELLPLTTGLGEIYQYSIVPDNPKDTTYSLTELRTIQDWIVKRQLLGTPGVAEVSSYGGFTKQYQVIVNPASLKAAGMSLQEVFNAVNAGNSNTGAAYIEKNNSLYFIRGVGIVAGVEDLKNIFIKNNAGTPVAVKDVATVEEGSAIRFGGMVQDGVETAGGVILMLKGENSRQVVAAIKERLAAIQKTLPPGLRILTFLDRGELIDRTIHTVARNLMEGGLIVIFVLVLLLGNLRAGFIVASVIPLSLLFAIGMMTVFHVSGNLMSLGAIDFGLIVDGAVIIVENVVRRISQSRLLNTTNVQKEATIFNASNEIRQSAMFGEIIIMIVYIPLLLLTGIEGKMFNPMALTVIFSLAGAFLLSLTYVPMISALLLKNVVENERSLSERILNGLKSLYRPVITFALSHKNIIVGSSIVLLAVAGWLFSTLGGEFIPSLDEGDFLLEVRMPPGTALTQMLQTARIVEALVKKEFPDEIELTNAKMGASEVPTDPMGVEEMDMLLKMYDHDHWKRCHNREDFEKQLGDVMAGVPGVTTSIMQPTSMRFNDLMTGAKTDLIVKVLGPDLNVLSDLGDKVIKAIKTIPGTADVGVSKAKGMPQLFVTYKRDALLRYGISIDEAGNMLEMAIAGKKAGVVYEGNRRFDVTVRLGAAETQKMEDIGEILVTSPQGVQVPLKQLADISIQSGPVVVSRQNNERALNVNINVRGRDIQSVVSDVQKAVEAKVKLPQGYRATYGGQFENLQNAKNRLMVVVPGALALILLLLYLTFNNFTETALIFSAIPFSAIGGVIALCLRQMPFSISAGVGFIALFGVAVLNGMVLIGYFNHLEHDEGVTDVRRRVMEGVMTRFRPVIMTATVASLGFLPMALSTGAGAEVQKPLATVVIGGLISATLLTLILLPVLYSIVFNRRKMASGAIAVILLVFISIHGLQAQNAPASSLVLHSEQEAIDLAFKTHPSTIRQQTIVAQSKALIPTARLMQNPEIFSEGPQVSPNGINFGIAQQFSLPSVYKQNEKTLQQRTRVAEADLEVTRYDIELRVRELFQNALFVNQKINYLKQQDSVFSAMTHVADVEFRTGATTPLDKLNLEVTYKNIHQQLNSAGLEYQNALAELGNYIGAREVAISADFNKIAPSNVAAVYNDQSLPLVRFYQEQKKLREEEYQRQRLNRLPGLNTQISQLVSSPYNLPVFHFGLLAPIWKKSLNAQIKGAELDVQIAQNDIQLTEYTLQNNRQKAFNDFKLAQANIDFVETNLQPQAEAIIVSSQKSYRLGEITAFEFLQSIRQAFDIKMGYLTALQSYNAAVIRLNYFR